MKRHFFAFFFLIFASTAIFAQSPAKYWVEFNDKKGTGYSISKPEQFLSPRAIEMRKLYNITIDERDLPVNQVYINEVLALDTSARCFTKSKWLNGITIYAQREDMMQEVAKLPFVKSVERTIAMKEPEPPQEPEYVFFENDKSVKYSYQSDIQTNNDFDYGKADAQVRINNVHWLHRMGFRGEGMQMMVLDGGFQNVDTLSCFRVMRDDGRLLGARNIVQPEKNPMRKHTHGTMVLSCITSYIPGTLVGAAPMAQAYVCQTEDSRSENRVEEDNWVAGLEYADSLGCQVVNSSLGYTTFDDTVNQRRYEDLDGETSRASRAAAIAASKGMIICNSAGNEGGKNWKYIGAPADAKDIITVGAVNTAGKRAYFSSFGPAADGRIKPDACAVGRNTFVCTPAGVVTMSNGTSFSSPLLSGMVACLWQAFPDKSNYQIMDAVRRAGDRYPTNIPGLRNLSLPFDTANGMGYGITNFLKAYNILKYNDLDENIILLNDSRSFCVENNVKFLVNGSIYSQKYNDISVVATPVYLKNNKLVEKKPIELKTKKTNVMNNQFADATYIAHSVTLPKLSKKKKFQLYRIDIQVDERLSRFVIGQEILPKVKSEFVR